jgi:hypothetical protein
MALPACPTGCGNVLNALPKFTFCDGNPQTNQGEIDTIYLGQRGQPFADIKDPAEWTSRLSAAVGSATKIYAITVLGDKPKPTGDSKAISGGRTVKGENTHTINYTIDETNEDNHEAIRLLECGGQFDGWYKTSGGIAFGSAEDPNEGIKVSAEAGMVIPRDRGGLMTYEGSLTWKHKYTESRFTHPLA